MKLEQIVISKVRAFRESIDGQFGHSIGFTDRDNAPTDINEARYTYLRNGEGEVRIISWRKNDLRARKPHPIPKRLQRALKAIAWPIEMETEDE